ncbi:MAG: diguanylate cyclase [Holophagaceae bacterium]|nr:diguanylate cyclase [Holophagaceae bacterium]
MKRTLHPEAAFGHLPPLRISLAYALIATCGIGVSDWVINLAPPTYSFHFAFAKDLLFVLATACLVYFFVSRELRILRQSYLALEEERSFIHSLVQSLSEGIVATDAKGSLTVVNRAAHAMAEAPELLVNPSPSQSPFRSQGGVHLGKDQHPIHRALRGETVHNLELELRTSAGTTRAILANASPIRVGNGPLGGAVMALLDLTESRRHAYQALHDALTGLPNRVLFMDRLDQALKSRSRKSFILAVLFLDLDDFKPVNDELGHAAGDVLLRAVAERMQGCLRPGDTLARFGGDEFVFLLDDLDDVQEAGMVARRVIELLERPFKLNDAVVSISGCIGGVLPADGTTAQAAVDQADAAMYQAKRLGRGRFLMVPQDSPDRGPEE